VNLTLLNSEECEALQKSLYVLHVNELKHLCTKLSLCEKGKKLDLILRIRHFAETGKKGVRPKFPKAACGEKGQKIEIAVDSLMLRGVYKNDLKNRLFFKGLIGDHFHFTAFGIDWLNKRWMDGDPPTYGEFAYMWETEWARRKRCFVPPKEEWAYINFVQNYDSQHPNASRTHMMQAWARERDRHVKRVESLLERVLFR